MANWTKAAAVLAAVATVTAAVPAAAQKKEAPPLPEVFAKVLDCRAIADPAQRLACFDAAVPALAEAQESKELRVVSREDVNRTRRGLFGFVGSGFGIFGDDEDEAEKEEIKEITAVIKAVSGSAGTYVFTLDDGSVWAQSDETYLKKPQAGKSITIRRAALGSFMASVEGGLGFRIRRRN
ncbi:hypothetical protein [Porphyrobacter sp. AAP82]|uniref:hypothetical protein n=1 Tax=Porphyrobacter sp. AAP82 TaxID=1248917 RepID=UPI0003633C69|nr:hypothetical protein [Porphyrobacter sp. AAP82]